MTMTRLSFLTSLLVAFSLSRQVSAIRRSPTFSRATRTGSEYPYAQCWGLPEPVLQQKPDYDHTEEVQVGKFLSCCRWFLSLCKFVRLLFPSLSGGYMFMNVFGTSFLIPTAIFYFTQSLTSGVRRFPKERTQWNCRRSQRPPQQNLWWCFMVSSKNLSSEVRKCWMAVLKKGRNIRHALCRIAHFDPSLLSYLLGYFISSLVYKNAWTKQKSRNHLSLFFF